MKYDIQFTNQFKKDLELAKKQNKNLDKLFEVIDILANGGTLDAKYRDHDLTGNNDNRPETLLAAVNTFFTDMVILPPAVLAQKERPFQPPFFTSAHRQSCSGTSRPGFLPSGGLCSAHSRFAFSNRSRMEGFSGVVRSAYS